MMIRQAATRPYTLILRCKCKRINNVCSISTTPLASLSTKDVFFRNIPAEWAAQVPSMPSPPQPPPTIAELLASGESLLDQFGLWDWWKPSAWYRFMLESLHLYTDYPWFTCTIICASVIRLSCFWIPLRIKKLTTNQLKYQPETLQFTERMNEARLEGNFLLTHQIYQEQRDFMKRKGIDKFIIPWIFLNAGIFTTQFFAIRGMAIKNFPGFGDGGFWWIKDLTIVDPYYILPAVTAVSMHFALRTGLETGNVDLMTPLMRTGMLYGAPFFVFLMSSYMPSAIAIYWCTNNIWSIIFAMMFKTEWAQRRFDFKPPPTVLTDVKRPSLRDSVFDFSKKLPFPNQDRTTRSDDMNRFRKAGRSKPILEVEAEPKTPAGQQSK